jgi:hypothetical protein
MVGPVDEGQTSPRRRWCLVGALLPRITDVFDACRRTVGNEIWFEGC